MSVAFTDAVPQWTLNMPAGSLQQWTLTLTSPAPASSPPYPIPGGATWEYVVRATAVSSGSPLFSVTATVSASGLITVTSSAVLSQVLLAVYPAATSGLTPGSYAHALWLNPGTATAVCVFAGLLTVEPAAQP